MKFPQAFTSLVKGRKSPSEKFTNNNSVAVTWKIIGYVLIRILSDTRPTQPQVNLTSIQEILPLLYHLLRTASAQSAVLQY